MTNNNLDQKAMLARYERVYQCYNQQCRETDLPNKIAMQNRGNLYHTGYRCIVNFCTAYHRNKVEGYMFTTSAALLAQDWGIKQQSKTVRRHLIRLSSEKVLDTDPTEHLTIGITLFTKMTEFKKGFFKNVHLWLNPGFIVFQDKQLQKEHESVYPIPIWKPPKQAKPPAGTDQSRTSAPADGDASATVRTHVTQRLSEKFRVIRGK